MTERVERRSFLKASSALALGLGVAGAAPAPAGKKSPSTSHGKLPYRMIYNQDDTNLFFRPEEPIEPEHVDQMVDEVAEAGADLFLACGNSQRVNYPSDVWPTWWDEYRARGTVFGGKHQKLVKMVQQQMRLADMGCDYLKRVMERCAQRGIASGVTVRIDDRHWRGPSEVGQHTVDERLARFYCDEDIYLPESEWNRHGAHYAYDYECPKVREHYLSLIRELVERYDLDVLDLDFMRHPPFFDRTDLAKHCETMTNFVREINKICAASEKGICICARVPATPANCRGLGLDVGTWAGEGLVSGIALGMKNCTGWEAPVDAFRPLVGPNVSLYAGAERQAGRTALAYLPAQEGQSKQAATPWSRETLRGFAAGQLANGADGIYLFNFFCGNRPIIDVVAEMRTLETLRGKPKTYRLTTYGTTHAVEADVPMQVPVPVMSQQARRFEMLLATEPAGTQAEAIVLLDRETRAEDVWLQLNETPLGHASQVRSEPQGPTCYSWWNIVDETAAAVFNVPVTALKDGRNGLVLRNEGHPVTALGIAVRTG